MVPEIEVRKRVGDRSWLYSLGWLVVDRVALGVVVAIIAFVFNAQLQKDQKVGDYQKVLFEKRVKAYEGLTAAARDARDRCVLSYQIFLNHRPLLKAADVAWQVRLAKLSDGIGQLAYRVKIGDAGGYHDTEGPLATQQIQACLKAVTALQELDHKRTEAALFISAPISLTLDRLLEALTEDLEAFTQRVRKSSVPFTSSMSEDDQRFVERALLRAEDTYGHLLRAVDEALRVREMILG